MPVSCWTIQKKSIALQIFSQLNFFVHRSVRKQNRQINLPWWLKTKLVYLSPNEFPAADRFAHSHFAYRQPCEWCNGISLRRHLRLKSIHAQKPRPPNTMNGPQCPAAFVFRLWMHVCRLCCQWNPNCPQHLPTNYKGQSMVVLWQLVLVELMLYMECKEWPLFLNHNLTTAAFESSELSGIPTSTSKLTDMWNVCRIIVEAKQLRAAVVQWPFLFDCIENAYRCHSCN